MTNTFFNPSRFDCILIWGHGLLYFDNILNDIKANKNFEILKISRYKPKSIKSFVKEIYSHDYAPVWHLKSKTKYLLSTPREVCFVFVKNLNPNEDYFGNNNFRHKESLTLKYFKEELRDKYNSYEDNKRTHNHVIHATDTQLQTDKILKFIGYKQGIYDFNKENKFLDLPHYIKGANHFKFEMVNVSELYCNIIVGKSWESYITKTMPIKESPQYKGISENMILYENYIKKFLGGPLQENYNLERYKKLIEGFEYLKSPYENSFVVTKKVNDKYIILDGLHRASCHIYIGNKKIKICQILK